MTRGTRTLLGILLLIASAAARAAEGAAPRASLDVSPREAAVGDALHATLTLELPSGTRFDPPRMSESFGALSVLSGAWAEPEHAAGLDRYRWSGTIAAYTLGSVEVPAISIEVPGAEGPQSVHTEPLSIAIRSTLPAAPAQGEAKAPDLGDLKAVASIPPDFGPLKKALFALAALLVAAAGAWWLHRRYAARLAAVPAPEDPFHRMPPHLWAYQELKNLLDGRLAEEGKVDVFFSELTRILKTYLGGRYRVDLLESTTGEIVPLLRQAGAPTTPILESRALLERADLVKFARQGALPEACRRAVEEAYRIVDSTKPVEEHAQGAA